MERTLFESRILQAAAAARQIARGSILEPVPEESRFRVSLNASYDGNDLHEQEVVFPEDRSWEGQLATRWLTSDEVIDLLWREGRVPEWADLAVIWVDEQITLIRMLVCGRFTDCTGLLYHVDEGYPPFHVTGPPIPSTGPDTRRVSVYSRASCTRSRELQVVAQHAESVRALNLWGPDFSDDALEALPEFPEVSSVRLTDCSLSGPGLSFLERMPRLRDLRIQQGRNDVLSLAALASLPTLESLELHGFTDYVSGIGTLVKTCPSLRRFSGEFRLALPPRPFALPASVQELKLCGEYVGDTQVSELLTSLPELRTLALEDTTVTDAIVPCLVAKDTLTSLTLARNRISRSAAARLRTHREDCTFHPPYWMGDDPGHPHEENEPC